jgi:integrase
MAESRLRNHVRPFFGDRAIDKVGPADIRRWQTQLATTTGHATVQQCRSLLLRIFQYAVDEGALDANPVRKVAVPKRRADPDKVFGQARRRALTPEEAGQLLARFPLFWWDHVLTLLGTGLPFGELAGCAAAASTSTATHRWSRWLTSATRPAASAAASNRGPRATPASVKSHSPPRS